MLKSISWIVALSIIVAPVLPARADIFIRSTLYGSSLRVNSGNRHLYRSGIRHYPNQVIIRQDSDNSYYPGVVRPYSPYNHRVFIERNDNSYFPDNNYFPNNNRVFIERSNTYNPYFPNNPYYGRSNTVIVVPRAVIINPGYSNSVPNCGTAIYGSSIPSPIPVNPYTGLACR